MRREGGGSCNIERFLRGEQVDVKKVGSVRGEGVVRRIVSGGTAWEGEERRGCGTERIEVTYRGRVKEEKRESWFLGIALLKKRKKRE